MSNRYTSIIDGFTKNVPKPAPQPVYVAPQPTYVAPAPRPSVGKKQKIVEVIIEKPVIVQKFVDIPEDVIIEKPVERRIEQEVYTERVIEVPREEVVERDVEVIREEIKEIVIEKKVEVERIIDIPVETYREVPVEVIREVEVKVPVYKDKYVDRTKFKPIETVVQEIPRYVDKPVYQDRVVERKVEIPVDRVVERVQERRVEVPYTREVEKVFHVDKVIEVPVERIHEVYVDKIVTKEVQVPVKVDKYVDKPYDVVVEKVVQVPREVVRENRVTVPVDKVIEIPVERIVEIPIRNEKNVENVFAVSSERPVFTPVQLDIPVPKFIDKPVQANAVVEVPSERVVERRIDVPFGKVVERPVVKDLQVEVQRIVEKSQNVDRNVDIPVQVDKFFETFKDEVIEKPVTLQKIIERPVVVPKYVDRFVDKHVDVKIEVPIPKIVEIPRVNNVDKVVDANVRVQKARYSQRAQTVPINTFVRGQVLSQAQKKRFHESSQLLANSVVENEKLKAELTYLRERINIKGNLGTGLGANVNQAEVDRLRRVIMDLENSLRNKEGERNRLRQTTSTTGEIDVQTRNDGQDIPKLQDHIRRVKAENENLRRIANKGKFESTRNFIGQRVSAALGGTATGIQQFANAFRNTAPVSGATGSFGGQPSSYNAGGVQPQRLSGGYTSNTLAPSANTFGGAGANNYNTAGLAGLIGGYATRPSGGYTTTTTGVPAGATTYGGPSGATNYGGSTGAGAGSNTYGTSGLAGLAGAYANRPSGGYTTTTTGVPAGATTYGGPSGATNYGGSTGAGSNTYGTNELAGLAGAFANRPSGGYSNTTTGVPAGATTYGGPSGATNYGGSTGAGSNTYGTTGLAGLAGAFANRPSGGYATTTTGVPVSGTTSTTGAPIITRPSQPSGGQAMTGQW